MTHPFRVSHPGGRVRSVSPEVHRVSLLKQKPRTDHASGEAVLLLPFVLLRTNPFLVLNGVETVYF